MQVPVRNSKGRCSIYTGGPPAGKKSSGLKSQARVSIVQGMPPARLITIGLSHYCEKARWALDWAQVDYREEVHAPLAHRRATRKVGGHSVPVFASPAGVLCDSSEIVLHADALAPAERKLLPDLENKDARGRVLAFEDELDETLGVDARLLVYWYNLHEDASARAMAGRMFRTQSTLARSIVAPLFRGLVFRMYGVSAESAQRAEARVRRTFAKVGDTLGDRPFLEGDRFGLADLTFASLSSILLLPEEHPFMRTGRTDPSPDFVRLAHELRATRAGQHALRMYREHRGRG